MPSKSAATSPGCRARRLRCLVVAAAEDEAGHHDCRDHEHCRARDQDQVPAPGPEGGDVSFTGGISCQCACVSAAASRARVRLSSGSRRARRPTWSGLPSSAEASNAVIVSGPFAPGSLQVGVEGPSRPRPRRGGREGLQDDVVRRVAHLDRDGRLVHVRRAAQADRRFDDVAVQRRLDEDLRGLLLEGLARQRGAAVDDDAPHAANCVSVWTSCAAARSESGPSASSTVAVPSSTLTSGASVGISLVRPASPSSTVGPSPATLAPRWRGRPGPPRPHAGRARPRRPGRGTPRSPAASGPGGRRRRVVARAAGRERDEEPEHGDPSHARIVHARCSEIRWPRRRPARRACDRPRERT